MHIFLLNIQNILDDGMLLSVTFKGGLCKETEMNWLQYFPWVSSWCKRINSFALPLVLFFWFWVDAITHSSCGHPVVSQRGLGWLPDHLTQTSVITQCHSTSEVFYTADFFHCLHDGFQWVVASDRCASSPGREFVQLCVFSDYCSNYLPAGTLNPFFPCLTHPLLPLPLEYLHFSARTTRCQKYSQLNYKSL